ncbi:MAG: DUF11 domain-containing protein, partial [Myxococcales bacterium]|nr:DUF11 domain-containing protein [Myxococcales bacterium]
KTTTTVQAKVNEPIIYTLAWQNLGRNGATGVILTETIPETTTFNAGASDPNWVCEGVTPGKKCILQIGDVGVFVDGEPIPTALFAVTVDPVIPPSVTDIINVAALTQDGTNGTDLALGAAGEKTVATLARGPDLVLGATSTKNPALVGDTVRYTLNLSNNGTADANAILLTAKVPLNTTFKPATSSPDWNCLNGGVALDTCTLLLTGVTLGQPGNVNGTPTSTSRLFDVTVAATLPAGANKTTFEATSLAGGAADLASDNNGTTLEIALIGAPNLRAELAGPAAADPGQDLTYTVTLSNLGTRGSSGVVASMKVPLNSRYKAAGGDAWNCPTTVGGSTCTIPVGVIEPGATKTLTFLATVDLPLAANIVSTSAQASVSDDGANGTDSAPANNTSASVVTTLDAEPALAIDYKAPTSSSPGSTLTYSLDYWNAGDQNASGVKLTAVVPASTVFSTASSTAGWDCDPSTGAAGAICTLAVVGEVLGNRSSATASTATFSVIVDSKLPSGLESTSSTATIRDDIDLLVIDGTDTVVVQLESAPDLTITQSVGAQTFEPGDNITFNLTMKNTGSQTADNVEVTAKVPANTTFQSALSTQGWTCDPPSGVAGATCKLPVGTLAVGTNVLPFPASFILKVDSPIAAGVIQTTGEVSVSDDGVNGPDLNPANNAQSRTVAISADPALQLTKKADVTTREPGEKIIYTLEYQNVGTQHSTGVVITDVVPVNTIFDPDASSPGWSCSGTVAGATCTFADPTLPVGQKRTLTYAVNITDAVPAGVVSVQNKATITDDGQNHDDNVARLVNSNTVTTSIEAVAGLNISFVNPQASVPPGGRANFTIAYSNTGLQEATGVNVVVTVPAGTTFDANGSVTKGWTCAVPNGGVLTVCTHSVGNIPVGATAGGQVSFTLEVSPTIPGPPAGLPDAFALEARLVETGGDGGATPASKTQVTLVARCSTEFNFETSGGSVQTSALWQYVAGGSLGGGYWKTGGEANVLEADPDIAHLNFTIPIPSTATGGLQPLVEVVFKHTGEVAPQRDFLALCLQEPKADGSPDYSCNVIKSQYNTSQNTKDNTRQANAGPFDFNDGTFDHVLLDASAFAGRNVTLSVVYQTNGSNDANPGLAILSVRQYSDADRDESLDGSSLLCDVCWDTDRDGYFNSGSPGYVAFVPARSCGKSAEDVELVDCDDTDGNLELDCSEDCADGIDNNNNGLVDCEDNLGLGCAVDPICSPCERTFTFDSAKNDNGWLVQGDAIFDVVRTPGASGFVTTAGTGKKRYTSYLVRDVIIPAGMPKPKVEVTFTLEGSTAAATDKIGVCFDTKPITNCASNALADVDENTGPTPQTIVLNVPPEKVGNGGKLNIGIYYDSVAPVDAPAKILIDQVAVRSDIDADERYENLDPTCDRCIDRDGDGYGDASDSFNDSSTCKTALGLPATTPDCNDANEGVNPGIGVADECARTGDQNCDNVADIADASCSRCGDGLVTAGEQCDDGDGTCKPWEPVLTGGNPVQCPAISEDGCSSTCQIEANVAPLYLSEVHLTRFGQAGGQYFELYNKSNSTVDPLLLGLNFSNKLGQKQNFSACNLKKSVIAPKSYYVVSLGVEGQTGDIVADAYCTGVVLSEAGDSLALKNGDGTQVIDTVDFSAFGCETTQSLAGSGLQRSIELVDPTTRSASLNDTASAWCVSRQKVLKADGTPTASDNYGSPGGPGQCGELFCDGIDDDCDGNGPDEIDPDLPDADFDGFCDNPVTTGVGDCDKTTALCHVDCTTNVDATDAIPDVPDCRDRCIDKDNDGYGAPGNNTTLVSEPSNSPCLGIVSQKDDCTFCKANPNEPSCVVCSFGSSLDPKCAEDCNTLDGTTLLDAGVTNCRYPRYECNVCLGAVDTIGDCGCNKPENAQLDKCKFTIPGKTCNDAPVQICEAGTCVALRAQCEYCKIDTNKEDSALCADCKAGSTNGICAPDCNLVPENSCDTLVCTNPRDECQACAANNDFNCQSACVADPASPKCGLGCMKFPTRLCPNLDCFDSDNRVNAGDLEGQPKNPDGSSVAGEAVAGSCTDGVDNDCDGRADCSDEGCAKSPECEGATCEAPLDVQCGYDAVTPVISPDYLCSSRGDKGNDAVLRFRATAPQFKDGGKVTILIDNKANPSSYAVRIFEDTCPGASCPSSEADGGFVPAFCGESKPADIDVTFGQEVYIVVDEEIAGCGSPGESAARVTIRCNEDCGFPGDDDADGKEDCFDEECISEKVCADADFDGDGFKNGEELKCGKSAQSKADKPSLVDLDDTDADGTLNCTDVDDDGDGLADTLEGPNKLKTSPVKFDTDGDGLSDGEEDANLNGVYDVAVETNPVSPDTDADALSDGIEAGSCYNVTLGTLTCETSDPLRKDHDGDGLQDGIEDANLNGRVDVGETSPLRADSDGDGFNDGDEFRCLSNPLDGLSVPTFVFYDSLVEPTGDRICDGARVDSDGDGIVDGVEELCGTNGKNGDDFPSQTQLSDTDGDGFIDCIDLDDDDDTIPDVVELRCGYDPKSELTPTGKTEQQVIQDVVDEDGDGLRNCEDSDDDNDGFSDEQEAELGTDPLDADSDDDGLHDGLEGVLGIDPLKTDTDGDGIYDGTEYGRTESILLTLTFGDDTNRAVFRADECPKSTTKPEKPDTDGDGQEDGEEDANQNGCVDGCELAEGFDASLECSEFNPNKQTDVLFDSDGDTIPDTDEKVLGTDPNDSDTDGDRLNDGIELNIHKTDPLNPDTDDGGINDGDEVDNGTNPKKPEDDFLGGRLTGAGTPSCGTATSPSGRSSAILWGLLLAACGAFVLFRRRANKG